MKLDRKKVAILSNDGFEQSELFSPKEALENEGAEVHIISTKDGSIKGWDAGNWGKEISVDRKVSDVKSGEYDALVLPGGVINPDSLRSDEGAQSFIRGFFKEGKIVAAICHGPQSLINADVVNNRTMTSYPSIKLDLENAGVNWVDKEVVVDQGLVTSRNPNDLPAFNKKLIEEIREGKHELQKQSIDTAVMA